MAFSMAKLKLLNEYDKNKGIDIVLGRTKEIPEGISFGKDLILVGDCTKPLRKKLDEAGKSYLFAVGCPPGEPLPYWAIVDRKNQPDLELFQQPEVMRKRLEDETDLLLEKLKTQKNE